MQVTFRFKVESMIKRGELHVMPPSESETCPQILPDPSQNVWIENHTNKRILVHKCVADVKIFMYYTEVSPKLHQFLNFLDKRLIVVETPGFSFYTQCPTQMERYRNIYPVHVTVTQLNKK